MKRLYTCLLWILLSTPLNLYANGNSPLPSQAKGVAYADKISPYEAAVGNECLKNANWIAPLLLAEREVEELRSQGKSILDLRPNEDNTTLYLWDGTLIGSEIPPLGEGMMPESIISCEVTNKLWSGAGFYYSIDSAPLDFSMINDNTHLHISFCTPVNSPESIAFILLDNSNTYEYWNSTSRFSIGEPFDDNGQIYQSLFPEITREWHAIDITIGELKYFCPDCKLNNLERFNGNVLSFLAGGRQGTQIALSNIYLYNLEEDSPLDPPTSESFYLIGKNVNGKCWSLEEPDARFEYKGNGIYVWEGNELGDGFKINDGSWDNDDKNIGSASAEFVTVGKPFPVEAGGNSANIHFENTDLIDHPKVTFDYFNMTILVEGVETTREWYLIGDINGWVFDEEYKFTEVEDGLYYLNNITCAPISGESYWEFKIATPNWMHVYGPSHFDDNFCFHEGRLSVILTRGVNAVTSSSLSGEYNVILNDKTGELKFILVNKPEKPFEDDEYAKLTFKIGEGAAVESHLPQNYETFIKLDLDRYWTVTNVNVDGQYYSGIDLVNGFKIEMDSDKTIKAEVQYKDEIEWIEDPARIVDFSEYNISVRTESGKIIISGLKGDEEIVVYNLSGQTICSNRPTSEEIALVLSPGVYIVRINDNAVKVTVR